MQTSTLRVRSIAWQYRVMPVAIALGLGLVLVLGFAQTAAAQANVNPLTFGNNFFVTGDYVVAGAYGLGVNAPAVNGFATGTVNVPDANPGITGAKSVPAGAEIVAALLYWQTVEKSNQLGTGQNGFFGPVLNNTPQFYPISGATASQNTVSFSGGGCTGSSGGKVVRTYRASVRGLLPQDASGNVLANSTYEVRLANNPNAGLPTLGATLVIIYRVVSPDVPLNSIVIYDGSFAPGNSLYTMTQTVQGFYQAAQNPVSRLTHIVGSGHNYKFETVSLGTNTTPLKALPNLYVSGQPFPGYYGSWDNTTWTFGDPRYGNVPNPVTADDSSATTKVTPASSQAGCVSWGAVIFSTTVENRDNDGLLDVWKQPLPPKDMNRPGYCDASVNEGVCNQGDPSWVDLPGATQGEKDVFVQLDYMCSKLNPDGTCATNIPFCSTLDMNGNCNTPVYSFDPRLTVDPLDGENVVDKVVAAFKNRPNPIHLHVIPANAIQEQTCVDNSNNPVCASITTNGLTPFPNQTGVVGWKGGLTFLKNQLIDTDEPTNLNDCATTPPLAGEGCKPRFQHGRKDSYHYALFAHTLGLPSWTLVTGTLTSVTQSGTTVTFTTSTPHGLVANDSVDGNGRVTIANAITNPNLNGTQLVTSVSPTAVLTITQTSMDAAGNATYNFTLSSGTAPVAGDLVTVKNTTNGSGIFNVVNAQIASVSGSTFTVSGFPPSAIAAQVETGDVPPASAQTARPPFTFTINIGTSVSSAPSYTLTTDPYLVVASGQADEVSGFSDVGGQDSVIALGSWLANGVTWQVKAGTLMHELGHSLGLTHGGFYFDSLTADNKNYTPTIEANCKPNHQSVMNYLFQVDLLDNGTGFNVLDYSGQTLSPLDESALTSDPLVSPTYLSTSWYSPTVVGAPATEHCDGTPILDRARMSRTTGLVGSLSWTAGQDINFDGIIEAISGIGIVPVTYGLRGHDDWASIDPRQIGATGSLSVLGSGGLAGGSGGLAGGSGGLAGGSGGLAGGSGGLAGGSGGLAGGSGGLAGGSGGLAGGSGGKHGELTRRTANSVTRPPRKLTATEDASPRSIHLFFFPPTFSQIGSFNIYRQPPWVPGNPPTFSVPIGDQRLIFHNTSGDPHFGEYEFVDTTAACYPTGYKYFVTAVLGAGSTNPGQESAPSNTVSTGQYGETLTACYGPAGFNFTVPANAVQGSTPAITWTVLDLTNKSGTAVSRAAANTLVLTGPLPNSCTSVGDTTILANGVLQQPQAGASTFPAPNAGQYTLNLDTDFLCAGTYTVKLKLDSTQTTAAASQLSIDVGDTDTTPHVGPVLTVGTVGLAYGYPLTEHGGTAPFAWTFTGSLPAGITLNPASGLLSGTTCFAGNYNFTAMVTDSRSISGTQPLTLQINKANTTTGVTSLPLNANPSVFQQTVTFTVTVTPQYSCTPTGTVTLFDGVNVIDSKLLSGGMATFTTSALSVGVHNITASYAGDSNFNGSNSTNSAPALVQTVNKASTAITITSVSPSPTIVGQAVTVAYTLAVVAPGAGTPIGPTGTVMVAASDGSGCSMPAALGAGGCTLSPAPAEAGIITFTVIYSGDNNFLMSPAANGNFTVLIFVSDSQPTPPPPFTPTTTLPNAVVGSPYSNTVYESGGTFCVTPNCPQNLPGGQFSWTIASVKLNGLPVQGGIPGVSFQPNTGGATSGALAGTPTTAGTYTFTAMVTDSLGNTGTQNLTITVLAPAPVPFGLVSWYPFEGNANDLEKINNGNVVGTPQFVPGEVDNGFKPGPQLSGSLITVPDSPTLGLTQFTIGAWVRVDALDNVETMQIVWKGDNTAGDLTTPYSLSVLGSASSSFSGTATVVGSPGPGKVLVILTDGSGTHELDLLSKNALSLGAFHYVAVTADGQKVNLYIDGVVDGNSPASESSLTGLPFTNTNPLQIGGVQGGPAPGNNFDGVIDELQIWNRVLTPGEISGIFNTVGEFQPVARPAGLVSWWPAEGNYTDIINGNNGTPSGGVGFAPGEVGQAFSFNGTGANVSVPDNPSLDPGTSDFTVDFWMNSSSVPSLAEYFLTKRDVCGFTSFWSIQMQSGGTVTAELGQDASGTNYTAVSGTTVVNDGHWHHIALVRQSTTATLYIDGLFNASGPTGGITNISNSSDLLFANSPCVPGNGSQLYQGLIDEADYFNRALSAAEVAAIFNAGGAGKAKP